MLKIEPRIFIDHESTIGRNSVKVSYYKPKKDELSTIKLDFTYEEAITFCRGRMNDRRYRNYEMWITKS